MPIEVKLLISLVVLGFAIIDMAISYARGKTSGSAAIFTIVVVLGLLGVAWIVF